MSSTVVTFPSGATQGRGTVVLVDSLRDGSAAVVTDRTPFHPLDHAWPDQPGDRGSLAGRAVTDCLTGTVGDDGVLLVGPEITARRGEPGWSWVVVHVLDGDPPDVGAEVDLEVDADARQALSAGHTACHLAALALNAEVAERGFWRKDPGRTDALGHPDLDQLAITESRILPDGAFDAYRLGKSLRKKGFEAAAFLEALPDVQAAVTVRLAAWVATDAAVHVSAEAPDRQPGADPDDGVRREASERPGEGATLAARRRWRCELPDGVAEVPCGGTHVPHLAGLGSVSVTYVPAIDGTGFEARTRVHRAQVG